MSEINRNVMALIFDPVKCACPCSHASGIEVRDNNSRVISSFWYESQAERDEAREKLGQVYDEILAIVRAVFSTQEKINEQKEITL